MDPQYNMRRAVVKAVLHLAGAGNESTLAVVRDCFAHRNADARRAAVEAFVKLEEQHRAGTAARARVHNTRWVSVEAMVKVAELGATRYINAASACMEDRVYEVRRAAVEALAAHVG